MASFESREELDVGLIADTFDLLLMIDVGCVYSSNDSGLPLTTLMNQSPKDCTADVQESNS